MEPLCPDLYHRLVQLFGDVRVANPGQALQARYVPVFMANRRRLQVDAYGETYRISCPFCGDTRHRLSINYRWSDFPWLAKYFNQQNCMADRVYRDELVARVFGVDGRQSLQVRQGVQVDTTALSRVDAPGDVVRLDQLPPDHPANLYLLSRGFDLGELSQTYGVQWCERALAQHPLAQQRIIVPVYLDGQAVGWQARYPGELDWNANNVPKYATMAGFSKSRVLYGLDQARQYPFVVVVEGVTDVWRIGPPAVAIFGHDLSDAQRQLLVQNWSGGVVVLLLDSDAHEAATRYAGELRASFPGRVVQVTLPAGRDPGSMNRALLWRLVYITAGRHGIDLNTLPARNTSVSMPAVSNTSVSMPAVSAAAASGSVVPSSTAVAENITPPISPRIHVPETPAPKRGKSRSKAAAKPDLCSSTRIMSRLIDENDEGATAGLTDRQLAERIEQENLGYVLRKIEQPLVPVVRAMTDNGIRIDVAKLGQILCENDNQADVAARCVASYRYTVNLKDDGDIGRLLYEELQLPVVRRTANGNPSTDAKALQLLATSHPVVSAIQSYRASTAIARAARHVRNRLRGDATRVRCKLDPLGTVTGRFTASDPPLHGLPSPVLDALIAEPGNLLILADMSQFEFRVLAQISQDPALLHAYCVEDADLHRRTIAVMFNVPEDSITTEQREVGKAVNFEVVFGETAYGLADELGIELSLAQELLDDFFAAFPGVRVWSDQVKQMAQHQGYVTTLYGRRRRLPAALESDPGALRQAVNAVIQGTAADINKLLLVRLHQSLPSDVKMLLTVHDSVLLEVSAAKAVEIALQVRTLMEQPLEGFSVPQRVDVRIGESWGACKRNANLPRQ